MLSLWDQPTTVLSGLVEHISTERFCMRIARYLISLSDLGFSRYSDLFSIVDYVMGSF